MAKPPRRVSPSPTSDRPSLSRCFPLRRFPRRGGLRCEKFPDVVVADDCEAGIGERVSDRLECGTHSLLHDSARRDTSAGGGAPSYRFASARTLTSPPYRRADRIVTSVRAESRSGGECLRSVPRHTLDSADPGPPRTARSRFQSHRSRRLNRTVRCPGYDRQAPIPAARPVHLVQHHGPEIWCGPGQDSPAAHCYRLVATTGEREKAGQAPRGHAARTMCALSAQTARRPSAAAPRNAESPALAGLSVSTATGIRSAARDDVAARCCGVFAGAAGGSAIGRPAGYRSAPAGIGVGLSADFQPVGRATGGRRPYAPRRSSPAARRWPRSTAASQSDAAPDSTGPERPRRAAHADCSPRCALPPRR